MMKVLAIIPARGGSKGLPRKNILDLCGKPMIAYSVEAALKSKYVDRVVVSTEDEEIATIARRYGAEVPFMRPDELAQDKTPGMDPILYTVERLSREFFYYPDYILLLQPTSPLRTAVHIDEAIDLLFENKRTFDSLISVTELEHPVLWNKVIGPSGQMKDYVKHDKRFAQLRQEIDKVYRLNGAIYIAKTDVLLETKDFETDRTMGYVMDRLSSVDIDTKIDFKWAEFLMQKNR